MQKEKEQKTKGNVFDLKVLRRLLKFMRPYRLQFYSLLFLTIVLALLVPVMPLLISNAIDKHIAVGDYQGMMTIIWWLAGILIVQTLIQFVTTYLSSWLGQSVIRNIRIQLYEHILSLRLKYYDNTPIGRLVTRNISDIETLSDVFSQGIAAMLADLLQLITIVVCMLYISWELTLVSLAPLPILLLSTYIFKEKMKSAFGLVRTAVANLNTFVQEHVTGMAIVQIFGTEKRESDKFREINKEHRKAHLKTVKYFSIYFPVAEIIGAVSIGLLVWYGAHGLIDGFITGGPGVLIGFIMYINMFFRPIRMIADRFNTLQLGIVSTSRIIDLLDNKEHIPDNGEHEPEEVLGNVKFNNVNFGYKPDELVLKNLSFEVKQGETIALVGATGAGKTSVINLLNRFYEIQGGEIEIDGVNIKDYKLSALRENIGVVLQDVFLFSESIAENVSLGNSDIEREAMMEAAESVGARKFIERLPETLDYNVKERGVGLSVGQRQLISFVRAMVYNPKILVLDEATSSVDTETEIMIQRAIEKLMKGRTSIVIAHRLSTIQKADKIIVMDKGEIKEMGTHDELLNKQGLYANLYQMQYKNVS